MPIKSSAIPIKNRNILPVIRNRNSTSVFSYRGSFGNTPSFMLIAIERHIDIRMAGKKLVPPSWGICPLWIFRRSGRSYKCFLWEISRILGINSSPKQNDRKKLQSNKTTGIMFTSCLLRGNHSHSRNGSRSDGSHSGY